MTRKKKSRKPGVAPVSAKKDDKTSISHDKKPKKHKGKKSGSRQLEASNKKQTSDTSASKKDPRIGSQKPIVLTKATQPQNKSVKAAKTPENKVAPIKVVDNSEALKQELYAIEDDQQLQSIIAKQEQEIALTEQEVDYFNEKMDRHQWLTTQLGWDEEEDITEAAPKSDTDEDALWDKLDNNHLTDYE
ncbi:Der GTPase-activating protein YihI [Thalassotalea sp. G2M2-11]|uniref:Der GTPase-activating protein YihI n=1 Tax=Thalassotalea sp. G2M2-11 TaxID=2787627 RepID=UPI0019D07E5C|nr:Der GTPase-activating protein YihI [Thalassotalea sp. G2M2-11]